MSDPSPGALLIDLIATEDSAVDSKPTANHTHVHVEPSSAPVDPERAQRCFRRLHQICSTDRNRSWLHRLLRRSESQPLIEFLLVGSGEGNVEYYVGIDDADLLDRLVRALRGVFPDDFQLSVVEDPLQSIWEEFTDEESSRSIAGVEFEGVAEYRRDWQTRLQSLESFHTEVDELVPLSAVVEAMTASEAPMVYQSLLRPKPDWTAAAEAHREIIHQGRLTALGKLQSFPDKKIHVDRLTAANETRLEELDEKAQRTSFAVNARAVAMSSGESSSPRGDAAIEELSSVFATIGRSTYNIGSTTYIDGTGDGVAEAIRERQFKPDQYNGLLQKLLWTANRSPGIVADHTEAPLFCLVGGNATTAGGSRALETTPSERTARPRPPERMLEEYRSDGLTLGEPISQDGHRDVPIALPPALQRLHVGWFGKTGSGKSMALVSAILDNNVVTDGADILIDPKGDGMAIDYLRGHYVRHGNLDDVLYFDCADVLPAISFFDIRDELDAGIDRVRAVQDVVDHYLDILAGIMGRERFDQAVRSPNVIRYLVRAMFDPVNGSDAFSHDALHEATRLMHASENPPTVSDPTLQRMLTGVVDNSTNTFDEIMGGVVNRMEKIPADSRLATVFDHVVTDEDDPHFDLGSFLDEDIVIILDTGGLRSQAQRVLALVILSNLWTALRRRKQRAPDDETDHPLVNVYLEEAASIAVSELLGDLLAKSRGFDCSITLAMQFPGQLQREDTGAYDELLNNVSTFVTGNVPLDRKLAARLATDELDAEHIGNRLRALSRGEWLVTLPSDYTDPEPRPFLVASTDLPPGHAEGPQSLSDDEESSFQSTVSDLRDRTFERAGLELSEPQIPEENETPEPDDRLPAMKLKTAIPHTRRLPQSVEYDEPNHMLRCASCDNRFAPNQRGIERAINCCHSMDDVDPDDIPICEVNLNLTAEERTASEWSDTQLMFLQVVYNAQQLRYEPPGYDLLYDSMLRLQEYVGIDDGAVQELVDAELLVNEGDRPHRLYSVTTAGRETIGERTRHGLDHGHGKGDLGESSVHVMEVELGRLYLEQEYVEDEESPVTEVVPYHDIDEQRRLDVAGLNDDGEIVVTVEAERINNDSYRAVPDDFDKMADCDPEEAIWIVLNRDAGHAVLGRLNRPTDGEPRVERTYSSNTPPRQFMIDSAGLTAIYPIRHLRDTILENQE